MSDASDLNYPVKTLVETAFATTVVGSILGLLPAIAAVAAIIWYAIQIWESKTVSTWWAAHKERAHDRRERKRNP